MRDDIDLWEQSTAARISHLSTRGDVSRRFMDPRGWQVLDDVTGKKVLDIGCVELPYRALLQYSPLAEIARRKLMEGTFFMEPMFKSI
jgi:hypothetical protein